MTTQIAANPTKKPGILRRFILKPLAYTLAVAVPPLAVAVGTATHKINDLKAVPLEPREAPAVAGPAYDPAKPTAVVVVGNYGTEVTDFMPPYEILAESGAFNVFTVAPERMVSPVTSGLLTSTGLEIIPHFSFAGYDEAVGRAPDVIVVPYLPGYATTGDRAVIPWIRAHADDETLLVSVCAGSAILADTGLLTGHTITSHPGFIKGIRERHPELRLVDGVRYAEDRNVITSGSLTSGIDATYAALRKKLGAEAAEAVGRRSGYPYLRFLQDPTWRVTSHGMAVLLTAGYTWGFEETGVALYDGVSETGLASVLDLSAATMAARTWSIAPGLEPVRSKNGLILVPRYRYSDAPRLDRVVVPGGSGSAAAEQSIAAWARDARGVAAEAIHRESLGTGDYYDAVLKDIASRQGRLVADAVAVNMNYPARPGLLELPAFRADLPARPAGLSLAGGGMVWGLGLWWRRRRVSRKGASASAAA